VTKWEKNRIGHMEWLENVIEEFLKGAETVDLVSGQASPSITLP